MSMVVYMIVNMKNELMEARKKGYAIPQFNVNNLEWAKYILEECNLNRSPVIIGLTEGAIKYMGGYHTVSGLIYDLVHDLHITVPVSIHLDHGTSVSSCKKAIDASFTSVMIDASLKELDENINMTNEVLDYARSKKVLVEAEVGAIETSETCSKKYASVTGCVIFSKKTQVDLLAPSVGNVHGVYKDEPNINIKLIKEISEKTNLPLVLHGASGIDDKTLINAIENGICKVNINTDLQIAWAKEVRKLLNKDTNVYDPRIIISSGEAAVKKVIKEKLQVLNSINRY